MKSIQATIARAQSEGRTVLFEHELLEALAELGLAVPRHRYVPRDQVAAPSPGAGLGELANRPAVVKVVSEQILHKTDVGGVAFVDRLTPEALEDVTRRMLERLDPGLAGTVRGFLVAEKVPFEGGLGKELIFGSRHSDDFGAVFTFGFGGTAVEALGAATHKNQTTVLYKPGLTTDEALKDKLSQALFARWLCGEVRGVEGAIDRETLWAEVERWTAAVQQLRAAAEATGARVAEVELNPLVLSPDHGGHLVPLDAMLRLATADPQGEAQARLAASLPIDRLGLGVSPRTVALVGVSASKINVGRIILRSILDGGFDPERLWVVRQGSVASEQIDGVACVPSVAELPEPVDLLIVAVAASATVEVLRQSIAGDHAQAVLLIPGGMGETEGGKGIEQQIVELLAEAPAERRPAVIGNNSLGMASAAAGFDSLFIPRQKLPRQQDAAHQGAALISQSGAFMITQLTRLTFLNPALQISLGNQIDTRLSHFVELAAARPELRTLALYIEGFRPGDGERLASIVRDVVRDGRDVVVYKAGRSASGQAATMGHTASVAGDYRVFEELLGDAGALVADDLADFTDLVRLSVTLGERQLSGRRVALMSNAGYEAVAMADSEEHGGLEIEPLAKGTVERLGALLEEARIAHLVNPTNPLDVTPMAGDAVHEGCMRAMLDDRGVDLAVFGNVPLTSALQTLPPGILEGDRFDAPEGYAARTIALFREATKPFAVVIDAGPLYDPLALHLQQAGLPVFRHADRAVRLVGRYIQTRLGTQALLRQ